VRGEGSAAQVIIPHHDTVIESDDHVIVFLPTSAWSATSSGCSKWARCSSDVARAARRPRTGRSHRRDVRAADGAAAGIRLDRRRRRASAFAISALATLGLGIAVAWSTARHRRELQPRDGFLLVSLIWAVLPRSRRCR
jgi:hypothetical protein